MDPIISPTPPNPFCTIPTKRFPIRSLAKNNYDINYTFPHCWGAVLNTPRSTARADVGCQKFVLVTRRVLGSKTHGLGVGGFDEVGFFCRSKVIALRSGGKFISTSLNDDREDVTG